jgi:hypothetical protein
MSINTLLLDGEVVGYRLYTEKEMFDVDRTTGLSLGIGANSIKTSLEMRQVDDLWVTDEEVESGVNALDISENKEKQNEVCTYILGKDLYSAITPWNTGVTVSGGLIEGSAIKYDNGVALFAISTSEKVGEFFVFERKTLLYVVVENMQALERVVDLSDGLLPQQWAVSEYKNGKVVFKLSLSQEQLNIFQKEFICPVSLVRGGMGFSHSNLHTGRIYSTTIQAPDFKVDNVYLRGDEMVGATFVGYPLKDYLYDLGQLFSSGQLNYYPHLNLNMINSL